MEFGNGGCHSIVHKTSHDFCSKFVQFLWFPISFRWSTFKRTGQVSRNIMPLRVYKHLDGSTLIPAWISNHMPSKVWDGITHPFLNLNDCAVEVCERICNFILHFIIDVITDPCWIKVNLHKQEGPMVAFMCGGLTPDIIMFQRRPIPKLNGTTWLSIFLPGKQQRQWEYSPMLYAWDTHSHTPLIHTIYSYVIHYLRVLCDLFLFSRQMHGEAVRRYTLWFVFKTKKTFKLKPLTEKFCNLLQRWTIITRFPNFCWKFTLRLIGCKTGYKNFPGELSQCHKYWCSDSMRRRFITNHDVYCVKQVLLCVEVASNISQSLEAMILMFKIIRSHWN